MKRNGIINADISRVLSYMGHTDTIAVGDCGLPIPDETERIDLALKLGVPSFMEVLVLPHKCVDFAMIQDKTGVLKHLICSEGFINSLHLNLHFSSSL